MSKIVFYNKILVSGFDIQFLESLGSVQVEGKVRGSGQFKCNQCHARYTLKRNLWRHQKFECGKEPRFQCPYCLVRSKQKVNMERHIIHCRGQNTFSQPIPSFTIM